MNLIKSRKQIKQHDFKNDFLATLLHYSNVLVNESVSNPEGIAPTFLIINNIFCAKSSNITRYVLLDRLHVINTTIMF